MSNDEAATAHEKRDFFRIDQDVHFEFKPIDNYAADNQGPDELLDDSVAFSLINELKKIDREQQQSLKLLSDKNRLLGDYLKSVSAKIDRVARHVVFSHEDSLKTRPRTRINLSEEAIGFVADRPLYKGSHIALRLVFLPGYATISGFAKVVRCEQKDERYQVAARFHRLPDKERQVIAKQVMRAQIRKKKKPRTS